ncbi:MAG: alpha-L-fucosidase [Bacteroidales bacterium]|nr:alpha-L-fucosidase [Bacteroidales bacterium]
MKKYILLFFPVVFFVVFLFGFNTAEEPEYRIQQGLFQPTWESFETHYQCPEWFRDAKFGIWSHWSAQCVPEAGDWYARNMYIQGWPQYDYHIAHYGHPSKFGFMEIDNLWKAENWDPEKLMELYKRAGAKYFVTLANHHDNFDNYNSKHHAWNSVNVGPKKDIVGTWEKIARKNGLFFGVSNHSSHAWHWFQTAYGYDGEGPLAGVRYDGATLTKADGKGKWWEGLDPQELYTGPTIVIPDGINGADSVAAWHKANNRPWNEDPPVNNPDFTEKWFLRCRDLIDSYHPDYIYFDNTGLPLGQTGLDIVAHYYNSSMQWNNGKLHAVATGKKLKGDQNKGIVEDRERGYAGEIMPRPWQTCTCIGDWHYNRETYNQNKYKTVQRVVHQLIDIVSKNGNLLLSIPMRGDGTIDELEIAFLEGMADWMEINGEAIFSTRPWKTFGEGPTQIKSGMFNERRIQFVPEDIRFTAKGETLYAFIMGWPENKDLVIKSLAKRSLFLQDKDITAVSMLGCNDPVTWNQDEQGLAVQLPEKAPCEHAVTLKIETRDK